MLTAHKLLIEQAEERRTITYLVDERGQVTWCNSTEPLKKVLETAGIGDITKIVKKTCFEYPGYPGGLHISPCYENSGLHPDGYIAQLRTSGDEIRYSPVYYSINLAHYEQNKRNVYEFNELLRQNNLALSNGKIMDEFGERAKRIMGASANKPAYYYVRTLKDRSNIVTADLYYEMRSVLELAGTARDYNKKFRLIFSARPGLFAEIEQRSFRYAFLNLIINALMYSDAPLKICFVCAEKKNGSIIITVSDNGTKADLRRIQRFRAGQINLLDPGATDGEGIGLTLASLVSKMLHGYLLFRRTKKGGLTARIELPLSSETHLSAPQPTLYSAASDRILSSMLFKLG